MRRLILTLGLWLLGTMPALAFDTSTGEVLRYNVYWGPLEVGHAQLQYVPQGGGFGDPSGYTLTARVWDSTVFLDLDDTWRAVGSHAKGAMFKPIRYEAHQHENDYKADKVMAFDAHDGKVVYTNHIDAHDTAKPVAWDGKVRDVLSALYAWRTQGLDAIKAGGSVPVVGLKKEFTLVKTPGRQEAVTLRGQDVKVWRVDISTRGSGKHEDAGVWTVRLRDDASLVPVQITADTKFGTFRAVLAGGPY